MRRLTSGPTTSSGRHRCEQHRSHHGCGFHITLFNKSRLSHFPESGGIVAQSGIVFISLIPSIYHHLEDGFLHIFEKLFLRVKEYYKVVRFDAA